MRRKDRERDRSFALDVIDKCEYGVLAMTTKDGDAYCVPLSIARQGGDIYFHAAQEGLKTKCLRHNPKVCLTCVGDVKPQADRFTTLYESAVVNGTACEITDDNGKIDALRAICGKYASENMAGFDAAIERSLARTAVWKIHIDSVTGKCKA